MSNGAVIRIRVRVKPISTVHRRWTTRQPATGRPAKEINQRSDDNAVPAAGVVADAMAALVAAEARWRSSAGTRGREIAPQRRVLSQVQWSIRELCAPLVVLDRTAGGGNPRSGPLSRTRLGVEFRDHPTPKWGTARPAAATSSSTRRRRPSRARAFRGTARSARCENRRRVALEAARSSTNGIKAMLEGLPVFYCRPISAALDRRIGWTARVWSRGNPARSCATALTSGT